MTQVGQIDEAIEMLREARRLDTENGWYAERLGYAYEKKNAFSEALDQYAYAAEHFADDRNLPWLFAHQASCLEQLGHDSDATDHYKRALELNPDYPWAMARLVALGCRIGQAEETLKCIAALPVREGVSEWELLKGLCLETLQRDEEALLLYRALLKDHPQTPVAWLRIGEILERKNDLTGAIAAATEALRLTPGEAYVCMKRARLLRRAGRLKEAADDAGNAAKLLSADPRPALEYAEILMLSGAYDTARAVYAGLQERVKRKEDLLPLRARVELEAGELEKASSLLQQSLRDNPENPENDILAVRLEIERRNPSLARAALKRGLEKFPNQPLLIAWQGFLVEGSDPRAAIAAYQRSLAIERHPWTLTRYAGLLVRQRQLGVAETLLMESLVREGADPYAYRHLGEIYFRRALWQEARVILEKAATLDPENRTGAQDLLLELYWEKMGMDQEGRKLALYILQLERGSSASKSLAARYLAEDETRSGHHAQATSLYRRALNFGKEKPLTEKAGLVFKLFLSSLRRARSGSTKETEEAERGPDA